MLLIQYLKKKPKNCKLMASVFVTVTIYEICKRLQIYRKLPINFSKIYTVDSNTIELYVLIVEIFILLSEAIEVIL